MRIIFFLKITWLDLGLLSLAAESIIKIYDPDVARPKLFKDIFILLEIMHCDVAACAV